MTTQEAYNRIRASFEEDPRYGYNEATESCVYRAEGGVACAVGRLIPDGSPMLDCEGDVSILREDYASEFNRLFSKVEFEFLASVQTAHDNAALAGSPISSFIEELDGLAVEYDLELAHA